VEDVLQFAQKNRPERWRSSLYEDGFCFLLITALTVLLVHAAMYRVGDEIIAETAERSLSSE